MSARQYTLRSMLAADSKRQPAAASGQAPPAGVAPVAPVRPVQLLGLCPLLAVSSTVANAVGLAVASALVLLGSATLASAMRRAIPADVRLPCFVLVIATFTTLANLAMQAYAFELYERIALFVQIIVTNCLILGRIEQVASKAPVAKALADAAKVSALFAGAIVILGAARQLLALVMPLAAMPAGAFIIAGLLLAATGAIREQRQARRHLRPAPAGES